MWGCDACSARRSMLSPRPWSHEALPAAPSEAGAEVPAFELRPSQQTSGSPDERPAGARSPNQPEEDAPPF